MNGKASPAEIVFQKLFGLRRACRFPVKKWQIWRFIEIWRFHVKTRKIGKSGKCPLLAPPIDHCLGAFASQCPRAVRGIYFRKVKFRSRLSPGFVFFSTFWGRRKSLRVTDTPFLEKVPFLVKTGFWGVRRPKKALSGALFRDLAISCTFDVKKAISAEFRVFACFSLFFYVVDYPSQGDFIGSAWGALWR